MSDNEILRSLSARKSVRAFTDETIPEEARQAILEAAFQAPTAGNQMLYTILDITEATLKEKLSELCDHQPFIATAPWVLVFLADNRRWLDTYRAAGLSPHRPGAGNLLLAVADAVIAAQNAVVAAESLGLGSCYIGDILERREEVVDLLRLPPEVVPAAMLVFGHPTEQQKARQKPARFDARHIVQENAYHTLSPEEHREMFLAREAKEGKTDADFDRKVRAFCERKYEAAFDREMSRSAKGYIAYFMDREDV